MDLAELAPLLGGGLASQLFGIVIGMILHRKFVMAAVADADRAHEQAIATHRQLSTDLVAEFAAYRERTAEERGALHEQLATIGRRLDECRTESHQLLARVAVLEAQRPSHTN